MKNKLYTILLYFIFITGTLLICYPFISNYINTKKYEKEISSYTQIVDSLNQEELEKILEEAQEYNEKIRTEKDVSKIKIGNKKYKDILKTNGTDVMGYIEINKINVRLPIYHGNSEAVLSSGVGHINWSSLPIGGESTHSVLVSHRGLPSSALFTDLDKLEIGDYFEIQVMKQKKYYVIDQIEVVRPKEVDNLKIEEGEDYVTLVTCTPYGINSHRLLVRGHRIENIDDLNAVRTEILPLTPIKILMIFLFPLLIIITVETIIKIYIDRKQTFVENKKATLNGDDMYEKP